MLSFSYLGVNYKQQKKLSRGESSSIIYKNVLSKSNDRFIDNNLSSVVHFSFMPVSSVV